MADGKYGRREDGRPMAASEVGAGRRVADGRRRESYTFYYAKKDPGTKRSRISPI